MFKNNDIQHVYWLLDQYLTHKINTTTFCDQFHYSYDREINRESLTPLEIRAFDDLSAIAGRFSEFEEDHRGYPKAFSTEKELRQKILETKHILRMNLQ